MSQPINPDSGKPPLRGNSRAAQGPRDTVLLSDLPAISAAVAEPATPLDIPNLSSAAHAALSQRYDILGEAGHGSMGNVYKARDRETGETVALKLLKPEIASDQIMMDRFKNELLFARKITHKNVCRVHEFNRLGGIACTSMEFVEGESLRSVLKRFGGLPQRKAIDMALQICSGLKEAHAQGIVHRDLKPENIMIDANGNVKIMDFGIARSMEATTRMTGSIVGTPQYMAPEQVGGNAIDYRTDIYSLGLMLYEMFTGAPAFQADNAVAIALKQMRESPVPPHQIDPAIPTWVERAILKCIEKEPAKRFQSIADLESSLLGTNGAAHTAPGIVPASDASTVSSIHAPAAVKKSVANSTQTHKRTPLIAIAAVFGTLIVLGVFGTLYWASSTMKSAKIIPPPAESPLPKPPDIAYLNSSPKPEPQPAVLPPLETKPSATSTAKIPEPAPLSKTRAKAHAERAPLEVFPRMETGPTKKRSSQSAADTLRNDAGRSDAKSKRQKTNQSLTPETPSSSASYVWVGRYMLEDHAKAAAQKIEDLGLPAGVSTKHGQTGDFYVVYSGPFLQKDAASKIQQLEDDGFSNVHAIAIPTAGRNPK